MQPMALLGALAGGTIGALLWGGISYVSGYEVGYVAWAVGGVVGFSAVLLGGRGPITAFTCAMLSLVAIFAGKAIAIHASVGESRTELAAVVPAELYQDNLREAPEFGRLLSEDDWPQFMIANGYSQAIHPEGVTEEELDVFAEVNAPVLARMAEAELPIEEWRTMMADRQIAYVFEHIGTYAMIQEGMTMVDIVFAILGIATAGGVVMRATEEDEHRRQVERQQNEAQTRELADERARQRDRDDQLQRDQEPADYVGA